MGAFLSRDDLETSLGTALLAQLTDREAGQTVDNYTVANAIQAAEAQVWPALHAYDRVQVEANPDPVLKQIALPLALAALYFGRGKPEEVRLDEKAALAQLDRIARGDYVLAPGQGGAALPASSVDFTAPDRVFDAHSMAGY